MGTCGHGRGMDLGKLVDLQSMENVIFKKRILICHFVYKCKSVNLDIILIIDLSTTIEI